MSKVIITNTTPGGIGLPVGGIVVPGNGSVEVDAFVWQGMSGHPVVAAYVKAGRLEVEGGEIDDEVSQSTSEGALSSSMVEQQRRLDAAFAEKDRQIEEARRIIAERDATIAARDAQIEGLVAAQHSSAGQGSASGGYVVEDRSAGWHVITKDGVEVTKSLRKDAVEGFDAKSDEDKTAFVEENKPKSSQD